jgi:predicted dehydrogenase
MENKKIKIGLIGTGFARLVQIPAFQQYTNVEIVTIASARAENAERVAREFNIPHFTGDWRESLNRADIDLVSIVTPPNLHKEMTLAALAAGKHVLCEKPTAMNAAEAKEMLEAANASGRLALIDHELRFVNGRRVVYDMIRNGDLGKVTHIKLWFRNSMRGTADVKWNWWSDLEQGGGTLGAIGSHAVDTLRWLLGTEVTAVFCVLKTNFRQRLDEQTGQMRAVTSDDEAHLTLRLAENDLTQNPTATVSMSVVESGKYGHQVEIAGTKGGLILEEGGEIHFSKIGASDWESVPVELGGVPRGCKVGGWSRGFLNLAGEIVESLSNGRTDVPGAADFTDGWRNQLVLDAARESHKTGCFVKVAPV